MNTHLGPLVSALVDDQLGQPARDKALAHVAACDRCAEEVRNTRIARSYLSDAAGMPPLRGSFMDGLISLASEQQVVPSDEEILARRNEFETHQPLPGGQYCGLLAAKTQPKQWLKYGAVFALGGACVAAFLLGARPHVTPQTDHTILAERLSVLRGNASFSPIYEISNRFSDGTSHGVDYTKLVKWLEAHGWTAPQTLPVGATITEVGFLASRPHELEFVVDTPGGEVVIIESHGILDVSRYDSPQVVAEKDGPIYKLSDQPIHLAWQSGDTVIELVSDNGFDELLEFAETFEASQHDSGYTARLARGFTQLAGVVSE